MSDGTYRIGAHDWSVRRLEGRLVVHGEPLDYHVDESDHSIDIAVGNAIDDVLEAACSAMELAAQMEIENMTGAVAAGGSTFGGDISPLTFGDSAPLLPDDPQGSDGSGEWPSFDRPSTDDACQ